MEWSQLGGMANKDPDFRTDDLKRIDQPRLSVEESLLEEESVTSSQPAGTSSSKGAAMAADKDERKPEGKEAGPERQVKDEKSKAGARVPKSTPEGQRVRRNRSTPQTQVTGKPPKGGGPQAGKGAAGGGRGDRSTPQTQVTGNPQKGGGPQAESGAAGGWREGRGKPQPQVKENPPKGGGPKAGIGAAGGSQGGRSELQPQVKGNPSKGGEPKAGAGTAAGNEEASVASRPQVKGKPSNEGRPKAGEKNSATETDRKNADGIQAKPTAGNISGTPASRSGKRKRNRTGSRQVSFTQGLPELNMTGDIPNRSPELAAKPVLNESLEKSVEKFTQFLSQKTDPEGTKKGDDKTVSPMQIQEGERGDQENRPGSSGENPWKLVQRGRKSGAASSNSESELTESKTAESETGAQASRKKRVRKQVPKNVRAAKRKQKIVEDESASMRVPKKAKVGNYKEALSADLTVAIFSDSQEGVQSELGRSIIQNIKGELRKHMFAGGKPLRFEEDISWQFDHVLVKCTNAFTKTWLEEIIANNQSWGQGTILATGIGGNIPRRRPAVVYFRNLDKSLEPATVQQMLAWQNEGIAVSTWRLWNTRTFLDGVRYTFGVLKDEEEALKKLNGLMYFETGTVQFKLSNKAKKTLNPEKDPEAQEKEPEIMTLSEDENEDEVDQMATPMFPGAQFPPLGTSGGMAHSATSLAGAVIVEQVARGESSTTGGDLDQVLDRLNLQHI